MTPEQRTTLNKEHPYERVIRELDDKPHHDGIPEPYHLIPEGEVAYNPKINARDEIMALLNLESLEATMLVDIVVEAYSRGHAHQPVRSQALQEAARALRLTKATDHLKQARKCVGGYLRGLAMASGLWRGTYTREEAVAKLLEWRARDEA